MIELILLIIIICSLYILISNHPIYCLFSLILTFINFSILLLFLNLEFLALSYVIVYVGAICVLFIFVILLLNIRVYNLTSRENFWWIITSMVVSSIVFLVYFNLEEDLLQDIFRFPNEVIRHKLDIILFGKHFFNYNWQYLLLTVLLLLLAVISTISVSVKRNKNKQINFSFFDLNQ